MTSEVNALQCLGENLASAGAARAIMSHRLMEFVNDGDALMNAWPVREPAPRVYCARGGVYAQLDACSRLRDVQRVARGEALA